MPRCPVCAMAPHLAFKGTACAGVRAALNAKTLRAHLRALSDSDDRMERQLHANILEAEVMRILEKAT